MASHKGAAENVGSAHGQHCVASLYRPAPLQRVFVLGKSKPDVEDLSKGKSDALILTLIPAHSPSHLHHALGDVVTLHSTNPVAGFSPRVTRSAHGGSVGVKTINWTGSQF